MPTTTTLIPGTIDLNRENGEDSIITIVGISVSSFVFLIFLFLMCKTWYKKFKEENRHEPNLCNFCKYVILKKKDNRITPEENTAFKKFKNDIDFLFTRFYTEQVKLDSYGITEFITDYNQNECPICTEQLNGVICKSNCGHYYHKSCLIEWLRDNNNTCLTCRKCLVA